MTATYLQITKVYADDLEDFQITITDANGAAYDLTGLTPSYQYKDAAGAWQTVTTSVADPATGGIVTIDWAGTIPAGTWKHRLQVTDGSEVQTILYGELKVIEV